MNKKTSQTILLSSMGCLLGETWNLLFMYLFLNILDTLLGTLVAKKQKKINSKIGIKGIVKKISQWILILLSFVLSLMFEELGKILDVNFSISIFLGWYVFAYFVLHEFRSILEKLAVLGCNVPKILMDGLDIANNVINKK